MIFAYLDEFGHPGPFYDRSYPRHNASPVFGLAGLLMPERSVRPFASYFLKHKINLLGHEIAKSGKQAYEWEKKGTNHFTPKSILKYPQIKQSAFRLINYAAKNDCRIFYCGREKIRNREDGLNATGLYKTVFSDAIRQIDSYCKTLNQQFVIVIDQHSTRRELLETASKTMYGEPRAYQLSSPPFEVESYLNQNIQAADWIATIVGRLWSYELDPSGFHEYRVYRDLFWDRLHEAATHSSVKPRPQRSSGETVGSLGRALLGAGVPMRSSRD